MSDVTIGEILKGGEKRDAIHVAIAPAEAAVALRPGEHVALLPDGRATNDSHDSQYIGIVDPYLKGTVKRGKRFWIFLYPKTVIGMRHMWTHPAFPDEKETELRRMSVSEGWIRDYAERIGVGYDELMDGAKNHIDHEQPLVFGGLLEGVGVPDEFWDHYEKLTGRRGEGSFFSCSC